MQTTLLGLAITLIVALIAALIGPYFIDWNRFRPQFEAEAARVIGAPVRVDGGLDARLLPSPSLQLRSVVVGGPNDPGKVRVDNLAVEFSLGSLMRGEWRATELTINGVALDLGLDSGGRIDWPLSSRSLDFASFSIDRLNLTGRVALHDAASRSTLELNDVAFSGDVRSSGGSVRGDGNFMLSGTRYPFRISSGQAGDGDASHVHIAIDPGTRAASIDIDGMLSFDARVPHFDGALTLAGAAESDGKNFSSDPSQRPWRVSAKVKADPNGARLEQVDASYGAGDAALKLAGVGDVRFGASPRIHAELFARQLDADRLLGKDRNTPAKVFPALQNYLTKIPQPWLAAEIGISVDQIMLGGRPIQNFGADLRSDAASWTISRLEFRAPGSTSVAVNGQIAQPGPSAHFNGALDIESSDPDALVGWLQARSDIVHQSQKPLRLRGNLTVDSSGVAFDQLKADIEGGSVEGRLAFVNSTGAGTRAEAELRADRLDLDAAAGLVRAIAGPQGVWPDEGQLSLNVDSAMSAGQELRPFIAKLSYGPKTFSLEQLKIGSPGGLTMEGSGAFDRVDATGQLSLNATSQSVAQMTSLIAPIAPTVAARLDAMPVVAGAARLKLTLNVDKGPADKSKADARAKLDVDLPQLKGTLSLVAAPSLKAVRTADLDALARSEVTLRTKLTAERGGALPALLGLDRVIAVSDNSVLEGTGMGEWHAPIRLKARMTGADLDAEIKGTLEPWSSDRKADLNLAVRCVDLTPLLGLKPSDSRARNVSLSSHVMLAGSKLIFNDLDGTAAGARMRGRVAVNFGNEDLVDGEIGMDTLDLASAFGLAVGAAGHDPAEPLGVGLPEGWRGQLTFEALRGVLPGGIELRPVSGTVKADGQSLTFDAMKGKIGDGDAAARLDIRQASDGVALNAEVQLTNVDGSALHYGALAMPAGHASAQMTFASHGRSASALAGALSGNGLVTLEHARIPGLDPHMFDAAINASDSGASNDAKLQRIVEQSLFANPLAVASAQIPFTVRDGRLRVGATALDGDGAQAIVSGGYDIAADQVDIRAGLASTSAGSANNRPAVQIFAVGPPDAIHRSIDVAALSSWLAVRAIDRETRRLDSIEQRMTPSPALPPAIPPPAIASLPVEPSDVSAKPLATDDAPVANVPVPKRDPRRSRAKPRMAITPRPAATPQASNAPTPPSAAPLPAPVEIRPAPIPKPLHPRRPLVQRPPASIARPAL
ncbi:AsmA-like C-terminal region-containing protein [Nitrobacter sp. NHB1]|uniref:AsmA family protein n=1 Tax=Nitrobacter sp. NHB1 TaxID=3119830 RepID=UPI002FFD60F7